MPPPQAVICEVCGGKFFKHSYAHHLKQCIKKKDASTVTCDYCGHSLTRDEWDAHVPSCKAAHRGRKKKAGGNKSAVSDKARAKLAAIEDARKAGEDITAVAVPNADSKSLGGAFDPFANLDVRNFMFCVYCFPSVCT